MTGFYLLVAAVAAGAGLISTTKLDPSKHAWEVYWHMFPVKEKVA